MAMLHHLIPSTFLYVSLVRFIQRHRKTKDKNNQGRGINYSVNIHDLMTTLA